MQVARSFFFSTSREWRRKIKETYMALILEHRFSKERWKGDRQILQGKTNMGVRSRACCRFEA
jgi:membrane carboxypeptidase/penicillin-binding protein